MPAILNPFHWVCGGEPRGSHQVIARWNWTANLKNNKSAMPEHDAFAEAS
jgi:hypothetical protein